jgi:hypothetical protein
MFAAARRVTSNVCMLLPRNTSLDQLRALAPDSSMEVEEHILNKKFKTIAVYWPGPATQ